jgi:hypothetical protein
MSIGFQMLKMMKTNNYPVVTSFSTNLTKNTVKKPQEAASLK